MPEAFSPSQFLPACFTALSWYIVPLKLPKAFKCLENFWEVVQFGGQWSQLGMFHWLQVIWIKLPSSSKNCNLCLTFSKHLWDGGVCWLACNKLPAVWTTTCTVTRVALIYTTAWARGSWLSKSQLNSKAKSWVPRAPSVLSELTGVLFAYKNQLEDFFIWALAEFDLCDGWGVWPWSFQRVWHNHGNIWRTVVPS